MDFSIETARNKMQRYHEIGREAGRISTELRNLDAGVSVEISHRFQFEGAEFRLTPALGIEFPKTIWLQHYLGKSLQKFTQELDQALSASGKHFGRLTEVYAAAEDAKPNPKSDGFFKRLFSRTPKMWPELVEFIMEEQRFAASIHTQNLPKLVKQWNSLGPVSANDLFADGQRGTSVSTTAAALLYREFELGNGAVTRIFEVAPIVKLSKSLGATSIREESIKQQTQALIRQNFKAIQLQRAKGIIHELKPEKLREATTGKIGQISTLEKHGYKSVGDVYNARLHELMAIPSIGEQTANRMKAAAQTLYNEETNTKDFRLGNTATKDTKTVVAALARYANVRTMTQEFFQEVEKLQGYFEAVAKFTGESQVLLTAESSKAAARLEKTLDRVTELKNIPTRNLSFTHLELDDAWKDYLKRPAYYQAMLAELLGIESVDAGLEFLDKNTIEAIRKLDLNTSLMRNVFVRGYQQFAAKFVVVQKKMVLGDEMGLGKTLQAISAAAHITAARKQKKQESRILVVVPASLLLNWKREIEKFSLLRTNIAHGRDRQLVTDRWNRHGGFLITTYDSLKTLKLAPPIMVIADEAHMIKNPKAQRSQSVVAQVEVAEYAMFMTGTPIENRLEEFANLIGYMAPRMQAALESITSPRKFKEAIAPHYLRRNQRDVLDELPQKSETIDWVELSAEDQGHYRQAIASGAWMPARRAAYRAGKKSAKLERVLEIINEAKAERRNVIFFSYFLDVLGLVQESIGADCVGVITGGASAKDRQRFVDELGKNGHVLLAQIMAGGVGLNIQHASVVIIAEIQVKPSLEDQAIARAHRMGQINMVNVHRIVGRDTIDERLMEITGEKRRLFDEFARESNSAEIYDAKDITEIKIAQQIIAQERARLDIESTEEITLTNSESKEPRDKATPSKRNPGKRKKGRRRHVAHDIP